jgi:glutamate N-acetyltransferase/amino-acid N-acetyltransferase
MAKTAAKWVNLSENEVRIASTGVIGMQLPMDKIIPGIEKACSAVSVRGSKDASEAIMTTDTFSKTATVETIVGGKKILISGMAKGSGMIHPNMGTMLSFLASDVNISKEMLTKALKDSIVDSYNMVSVDGDTSTNDMVIILANGAAENKMIDSENEDYKAFKEALDFLNKELAKMIAKDGEGATKLIEVTLFNGRTVHDAKLFAKSVITSSLVKTAIFGSDANWGRIMCALGYCSADFDPSNVDIWFKNSLGEVQVVSNGVGLNFDEEFAKKLLDEEYVNISIDLKDGSCNATAWGCDLTYDYVKINGSYRS